MGSTLFRFKLVLAYGAVSIIWGSTYLAIRYAIDTIPPLMMAGSRNLLAGIPLLIWALMKEKTRPSAAEWARNGSDRRPSCSSVGTAPSPGPSCTSRPAWRRSS